MYLRLFGGARIDGDGGPVKGRAAQRRRIALLALLAASPGFRLTRERIIAYLWPERDSDAGRRLLSEALHVIRRELGERAVVSVGDELLLDPAVIGADVIDFRAAVDERRPADAVRLYSGPFLDGWFVSGTPDLDQWVERQRSSYASSYASILESLAGDAERAGDWRKAAEWWSRRVELELDSARMAQRLAAALAAAGETAAALKAISRHVRHMESEEFPVDPSLLAFAERLRADPPRRTDDVEAIAPPSRIVPLPAAEALHGDAPPAVVARRVSSFSKAGRLASGAALLSALLGGSALLWVSRRPASAPPLDVRRVAVLYFQHQEKDDVGFIADGLTEKLIDELSAIPTLRVVSKTGARHYRDLERMPPLDSVAAALRAGTIVEGRVQRAGNQVRVTVDLVDARTNTTLASRSIEHTVDAGVVFRVQDDVSERVAAFLRQRLGDEIRVIVSRMGTTSARAQELNDRAQYLHNTASALRTHGLESDIATAVRMLRSADSLLAEAEQVDPRWTSIRIERGWIARDLARLSAEDVSRGEFARAIEFADRVLSTDSVDARALELRGTARWQLARTFVDSARPRNMTLAEADLRRAMSLDSTRVVAAAAVSQLIRVRARNRDDLGQAIAFARQAYRQDAFLANAEDAVSQLYRATKALGQIDSARVWCARGHELSPDDWRFVECELALMRVDLSRARSRRARDLVEELDLLDPPAKARAAGHPYSPIYRRLVAAAVRGASGERDSARAELARALQEVRPDSDMMTDIKHDETLVRLAIGDRAGAMVALRRYLERRPEFAGGVLNDPAYRQFGLDSAALADALQLRSGARR